MPPHWNRLLRARGRLSVWNNMAAAVHFNIQYGARSGMELPDFLRARGYRRIGVVADAGVLQSPYAAEILAQLAEKTEIAHQWVSRTGEPTYDDLDEAVAGFRAAGRIDCMVGIGGGSAMDLAKGISVLLTNPGSGISYRGSDKIKVSGAPLVLLPTTAGTGSEVTPNASFTDTKEKKKQGISTSFYHPELVILDPLLVASCPRAVTIAAGMDALVHHAIDALISHKPSHLPAGYSGRWEDKEKNPVCALFAREAIRLLFGALPKALNNPEDLEARMDTQFGALYAGVALSNGGGGSIAGAISYPLGVHFHIPHGMAIAIVSREAMRFNVERGYRGYDALNDCVGIKNGVGEPPARAEHADGQDFFQRFSEIHKALDVPRLSSFWIKEEHLSDLAEEINAMPVAHANPVPIVKDDILSILKSCL